MITSLNHIGFEVPDWEEAKQFSVEALGFRELQPEELRGDSAFFAWHELGEGSAAIVCLEHASGLRIGLADQSGIDEILSLSERKQPAGWRYHLALNVVDLGVVLESLRKYPGVRIKGTSMSAKPPHASIITPWGMYIQLVESNASTVIGERT